MIEAMIEAYKECTEEADVAPDKVLRPLGSVFKTWAECECSTELPHWIYWKVDEHIRTFKGRYGKTLRFERNESIVSIPEKEYLARA